MDWYRPDHVTQQDGSPCRGANCWSAVLAWQARAATAGGSSPTPTEARALAGGGSGKVGAGDGKCRSGFERDIVKGLDRLAIDAEIVKLPPRAFREMLDTDERRAAFAVATDYELWPPGLDCVRTDFDGNHMVGFLTGLDERNRVKNVMNPLCDRYQSVPRAAFVAAAVKFMEDHGRDRIWLVRVFRPAKDDAGLDVAQRRIAYLTERVERLEDQIAEARNLASETIAVLS